MVDETKAINAKEIVKNPDDVYGFMRPYIMIREENVLSQNYIDFLEALAILKDAGWEIVNWQHNITTTSALLENPNYKRKNG